MRTALVFLLSTLLLLAGCSDPAPKRETKPEASETLTTIRLAYPRGYAFWVDPLIQGFQKAHTDYRIDPVVLETDYANVLREAVSSGKADVAIVNALPWEMASLLTDLEPYVRKSNLDMKGFKLEQSQFMIDGRLYGLPLTGNPRGLVGNTDLFKAADVPIPKAWTWDEFRLAVQKLTNREKKIWGLDGNVPEMLASMHLLQYEVGTPAFLASEKAWQETLQYWSTVVLTDMSAPPVPSSKEGPLQRGINPTHYLEGNAAIALMTVGPQLPAPHVYLPIPTLPGAKPVTYTWFFTGVIPAKSEKPDAGWEFLRYAAGPQGSLDMATRGALPMYLTPESEAAWVKQRGESAEAILRSRWMSHFTGDYPLYLNDLTYRAINQAVSGSAPVEQAVADFIAGRRPHISKP